MLRQCVTHGYFRGEQCPTCNEKGRFLMNTEELDRLGRIMAGILRHFPERFELDMDKTGFVDIEQMIESVKKRRAQFHWLKPHHLEAVVQTDPKGRYQIDEGRVRATYGHSIDVELDFPVNDIPEHLYYPSTNEELTILLETGLTPSDRKHVHLSHSMKDALVAGKHRVQDPIIIDVDAKGCMDDGIIIQHAGTTVYLTKEVPPKYMRKCDPSEYKDIVIEEPAPKPPSPAQPRARERQRPREVPDEAEMPLEKPEPMDLSHLAPAADDETVSIMDEPEKDIKPKKTRKKAAS